MEAQENKKEFYARKYIILNLVLMGGMLLFFIFFMLNTGYIASLPIGVFILVFILHIIRYNTVYLTIGQDYLSCKLSPVLAPKTVLFQEVTYIEEKKNRWIIYYQKAGTVKESKLPVPFNIMEDEERAEALELLTKIFHDKIRRMG
ncbi:hypothetical protein [Zophobihabitans entericus]|uniref:Photosystem I assembly protein Ycf4 n=1 Tax=Zophobihabitans entericus TaxID=1635327 RepID=A0A6G9IAX9_9GAMM|nr:hypothetical protein [Zophobihabitans entericus]QIQ21381.1 hypothetical protein IPMB12_06570 [Zophobihabitans entericus]